MLGIAAAADADDYSPLAAPSTSLFFDI
jgi:hypothetical protein